MLYDSKNTPSFYEKAVHPPPSPAGEGFNQQHEVTNNYSLPNYIF